MRAAGELDGKTCTDRLARLEEKARKGEFYLLAVIQLCVGSAPQPRSPTVELLHGVGSIER